MRDFDEASPSPTIEAFVRAVGHGKSVEALASQLGIPPATVGCCVDAARAAGRAIDCAGGWVAPRSTPPSDEPVPVAQATGLLQRVAVISDIHAGSKYCMRAELQDFLAYAHRAECREVFVCGDLLDGCYRHGRYELSHHGAADQCADLIATLPALPGLTYHAIAGNHDQTFVESAGLDMCAFIEAQFRLAGRADIKMHGNSSAYLRVRGALLHLKHPLGKVPYALSYRLQKEVEAYSPGMKPDILLMGHLHKFAQIVVRGVHAFLVPCWQSGGSAFANALVGQAATGGLILSWRLTGHGTLRNLSSEVVSYYHHKHERRID